MPHFRIALGYETEHRKSEPALIASGFSKEALQAAVNTAPAKFQRFEFGTFQFLQRAHRAVGSVPAEVPVPTDAPTLEEALAMLERIEKLEALLAEERAKQPDLSHFTVEDLMIAIERKEGGLAAALQLLPQNSTPPPIGDGAPAQAGAPSPTPESSQQSPAGEAQTSPADGADGPQLTPTPAPDKPKRR